MLSRPLALRTIALAAVLGMVATACGKFGEKIDPSKILKYADGATGCLNDFGPQMERYLEGAVEPEEWNDIWDCAIDSVGMFTDFVAGSSPEGYTLSDINQFIKNFLVTSKGFPPELVSASFKLKASLFGGGASSLTLREIDQFVGLLRVGKVVTTRMIPHLRNRKALPDGANLLAFAEEVARGTKEIGEALAKIPGSKRAFKSSDIKSLVKSLRDTFGWDIKAEWVDTLLSGKVLLLGGASDEVSGDRWPRVFEFTGYLGGAVLAAMSVESDYFTGPNELGEFVVGLARGARPIFENALSYHGGRLPLAKIDQLIGTLPAEWLTLNREVLKEALRPGIQKLFLSQDRESIGPETVDLIYKKLEDWRAGQTHLESIFSDYHLDPAGVSSQRFVDVAKEYLTTVPKPELPHVQRLVGLATDYRPLFQGDDMQIKFEYLYTNSLGNLSKMHWLNMIARHLIGSYSTHSTKKVVQRQDMTAFVSDFGWLALELGVLDPGVKDIDLKRYFEADNFVFASNGDGVIEELEATNYAAFLFSIGNLSKRILEDVTPVCKNGTGVDRYKHPWMDIDCFRKEYFGQYYRYWEKFPQMVRFYESLSPEEREQVTIKIEKAARRNGYTNEKIGKYDTDGIAGVIHYIEAVFFRFDTVAPYGRLNIDEVLAGFPKFKKIFAEFAKMDEGDDFILKSAFTYLVKFGKPPDQKNAASLAHFVAWMAWRPFWKIEADRMSIFNVFSSLAAQASQ